MTTDITIDESSGGRRREYAAFARDELPELARAVLVVADDEARSTGAIAVASAATHGNWDAVSASAAQHFYAAAVDHLVEADTSAGAGLSETPVEPTAGPTAALACVVAHYGLDWPITDIAEWLGVPADLVTAHIEGAERAPSEPDVRSTIKQRITEAQIALPDSDALERESNLKRRRKQLLVAGVVVLVLLLAMLGQFGSRRDRAEPAVAPTAIVAATATARPAPITQPTDFPRPTAPPEAIELADGRSLVKAPDLIADDGRGGFVGVRAGEDEEPAAVMAASTTGFEWHMAGALNLADSMTIDRFERSGTRFVAWLSGVTTESAEVIDTVGVTPDFEQWSFLRVGIDEPAPRGLNYESEIAEVAFRGDTILVLVTTTIEINFPELQLIESSTCGHSVEPDLIVVKLCNGGEIDVLDVAGIDASELPKPTRLFTGTDGFSLTETDTPFLTDAAGLVATEATVMLTDNAGRWIASSVDGRAWVQVVAQTPPGRVTAMATNTIGQIAGLGIDLHGDPFVFIGRGEGRFFQSLAGLVPNLPDQGPVDVAIGSSEDAWVIYLATPEDSWLLHSQDTVTWQAVQLSIDVPGDPAVFVGTERAVLQWDQDPSTTLVVEFD